MYYIESRNLKKTNPDLSYMEEKYNVYLLINRTLEEVFFGCVKTVSSDDAVLPAEIAHWEWQTHAIANPVIMAEDLSLTEAVEEIRTLQISVQRNPQGKTLLENKSL